MPRDDDELLDLLGRALDPPAVEPSLAEMHAFHRAIAARHRPRRRWAPRTMAVVIGLGALTTTGTAFALDGHVPRPVRAVASSLGLPVDSPAVSDARAAMARLRAAIDHGDAEQIRAAAASGRARFNRLSESERRSLGSDRELAEAEASAPAVVGATRPTADVRHRDGSHEGDDQRPSEPSDHPATSRPAASGSDGGRRSGSGGSDDDHRSTPSTTRASDPRSGDSGSGGSSDGGSGSGGSGDGGSGDGSTTTSSTSTSTSTTSTTSPVRFDSGSSGSGTSGSGGDGGGDATSGGSGSGSDSGTDSSGGGH